jgi:hypothetical protein
MIFRRPRVESLDPDDYRAWNAEFGGQETLQPPEEPKPRSRWLRWLPKIAAGRRWC